MLAILEYLPLIVFFITYKLQDIYWATGSLIITSAILLIAFFVKEGHWVKRHLIFFGVALVFGTLTLVFRNDLFIKWKVTVVYVILGGGLIIGQYWLKENPMKKMLGHAMELPAAVWTRINFAWAAFFLGCAIANLVVAFNMSQETWVDFKVIYLTALNFIWIIATIVYAYKYLPDEQKAQDTESD